MKASLRTVDDHGNVYTALMFVCPGCREERTLPDGTPYQPSGILMLPVNSPNKTPSWSWDGNLEAPTLSPSILSAQGSDHQCHSYLKAGVFEFLGDCAHSMAGQHIPMPDLPTWAGDDDEE